MKKTIYLLSIICLIVFSTLLLSCTAFTKSSFIADDDILNEEPTVDCNISFEPTHQVINIGNEQNSSHMTLYGNKGGDSGVYAYEIGEDYIRIEFTTGAIYLYTYESAGVQNIEQMKKLAEEGEGLNSFINKEVRYLYEKRGK